MTTRYAYFGILVGKPLSGIMEVDADAATNVMCLVFSMSLSKLCF